MNHSNRTGLWELTLRSLGNVCGVNSKQISKRAGFVEKSKTRHGARGRADVQGGDLAILCRWPRKFHGKEMREQSLREGENFVLQEQLLQRRQGAGG